MRRGAIFALAASGLLLGVAVVFSWGRLGPEPGSRNPSSWLGMLAVIAPDDASKATFLFLLVPALFLLTVGWVCVQRLALARRLSTRTSAVIAACWALPFVVGPVIGSRDAYAYVAQGELARRGLDPARVVVSRLGAGPLLAAVDPRWRDTRPPYGGVAVAIQKAAAAAGDGHPAVAVAMLRLIAVVAVLVLVTVTARMAAPAGRPLVVLAIAANPLVLVHLVAGAHLDAVAAALLVGGLAIGHSGVSPGGRRRWCGVLLCTLGAMIKLPVALGAVYLGICALVTTGPALAARLRGLAADVLAAAVGVGLSVALSGVGLGWLHNFGTPGRLRTGIAPADLAAHLVRGLGWLIGLHPDASGVLSATRLVAEGAGVVVALVLLRPRRRRLQVSSVDWSPPSLNRLAVALLALGLLGPVLYGWYLAPALPLLALAASPPRSAVRSARRAFWAIVALSFVLTFATVPSLAPVWSALSAHPGAIVALAVTALVFAVVATVAVSRGIAGRGIASRRIDGLTAGRAKGHNLDESAVASRL